MAPVETDSTKKRKLEESGEEKILSEEGISKTKIAKTDPSLNAENNTQLTSNENSKIQDQSEESNQLEKKECNNEEIKKNSETSPNHVEKPGEVTEKPKTGFVFGSTTKFGNLGGFKMFGIKKEEKNESSTKPSAEEPVDQKEATSSKGSEKNEDTKTSKPVFGTGSTFGNAFQAAISKKSVFDDLKPKSGESTKDDDTSEDTTAKDVYKKVDLEKQEVKSGEENEENLYQIKAKVYQMELEDSKMGWKERGFGIIKINKFKEPVSELYTSRIVMRQNGNFKLILNIPIVKGFKVFKGIPSSLSADKFIRLQMIENGKPIQYAVKVGLPDNAQKLFETIEKEIPQ